MTQQLKIDGDVINHLKLIVNHTGALTHQGHNYRQHTETHTAQ